MHPKTSALLDDIVRACDRVRRATLERTADDYSWDGDLQYLVERGIEIVGEAARRLSDADPETAAALPNLRGIIGLRNVIAHGYDRLDHAVIWEVAQNYLPTLRAAAEALLPPLDRNAGR
jgi:uncharacterized protein with HEPN domain